MNVNEDAGLVVDLTRAEFRRASSQPSAYVPDAGLSSMLREAGSMINPASFMEIWFPAAATTLVGSGTAVSPASQQRHPPDLNLYEARLKMRGPGTRLSDVIDYRF